MRGAGKERVGDTLTTSGVDEEISGANDVPASFPLPKPAFLPTIEERVGFDGCDLAEEEEEVEEEAADEEAALEAVADESKSGSGEWREMAAAEGGGGGGGEVAGGARGATRVGLIWPAVASWDVAAAGAGVNGAAAA